MALPPQASWHLLAIDVPALRRIWYGCERRNTAAQAPRYALEEIARLLRARQPSHALLAVEGLGSWRSEILPCYKANRPPRPAGLDAFEVDVLDGLASSGAVVHRAAGHEADDVIAAGVRLAVANDLAAVIVSGDKDLGQLVDDERGVVVWDGDERVTDEAAVVERWGVPPARLGDLLALAGDTGDNVPGVKGWGVDRARKVLSGPKPLVDLLEHPHLAAVWVPAKYRQTFADNAGLIRACWEVVRLRAGCLPGLTLADLEVDPLDLAEAIMAQARRLP